MITLQNPDTAEPRAKKTKTKAKKEKAAAPSPFAQARAIFWKEPKQDRTTFLAACEAVGMNVATAKTRWYCLTTDRDKSCSDPTLRGV